MVRLIDRRVGECVQACSAEDGQLGKDYVHGRGGMNLGEGRAIAGLALCVSRLRAPAFFFFASLTTPAPSLCRNPALDGFCTTGFDGKLTVWDARRVFTPLHSWGVPGSQRDDPRLTRAAMLGPDLVVSGGMDGRG